MLTLVSYYLTGGLVWMLLFFFFSSNVLFCCRIPRQDAKMHLELLFSFLPNFVFYSNCRFIESWKDAESVHPLSGFPRWSCLANCNVVSKPGLVQVVPGACVDPRNCYPSLTHCPVTTRVPPGLSLRATCPVPKPWQPLDCSSSLLFCHFKNVV